MNKGKELNCIKCNKLFYVHRYRLKIAKYCSYKCSNHLRTPWNKGKPGVQNPPKTAFKKGQKPRNYIDGRSKSKCPDRYGDDWDKIRLIVYKRDNYTCQECYSTMNEKKIAFHVHHKIPFLISFDNSMSNLITLCPSC